jgi:PE family
MYFIETPVVAAQSASEEVGIAVTGAMLAGAAPQMAAVVPMGSEEVSAALANAIAAHHANFLAMTGLAVGQRALFSAQVGTSAAVAAASDALAANPLTL